jgi:hypothetical protein
MNVFDPEHGIDLGLRFYVCDELERRNMANAAGGNKDSLPILQLLCDFAEEKLARELVRRDPVEATCALRDLRDALSFLVKTDNPEFQRLYDDARAGMERLARASRTKLVRDYLRAPPEAAEELNRALVEFIQEGYWPEWQREYEAEVERFWAEQRCQRAS